MPDEYNPNVYGQYVVKDATLGPSDLDVFLAGADAPGVGVLVILDQDVSANQIDVWTHPLSPEGTYYPGATGVAMATGAIAVGERSVFLPHSDLPCNVFGITVESGDSISHTMDVVLYGNGE